MIARQQYYRRSSVRLASDRKAILSQQTPQFQQLDELRVGAAGALIAPLLRAVKLQVPRR